MVPAPSPGLSELRAEDQNHDDPDGACPVGLSLSAPTVVSGPRAARREELLERTQESLRALLFEERTGWLFGLVQRLKHDGRLCWRPRVDHDDNAATLWLWTRTEDEAATLLGELGVDAYRAGLQVMASAGVGVDGEVSHYVKLETWR
jgi:hypothetical protein